MSVYCGKVDPNGGTIDQINRANEKLVQLARANEKLANSLTISNKYWGEWSTAPICNDLQQRAIAKKPTPLRFQIAKAAITTVRALIKPTHRVSRWRGRV